VSTQDDAVVRVMAEYECWPVWLLHPTATKNITPEKLGISQKLSHDLLDWSDVHNSTYKPDDPLRSGFADSGEEREFNERGLALARRLAAELRFRRQVRYFDLIHNQDVPIDST
jgi:hypothetical protein